ncbi:MAG TPA: hypothetical protein VNU71_07910 [Burkholderiaceae bacterium]|nr:hypothetical protein [Burkholderiaceae bacterium]
MNRLQLASFAALAAIGLGSASLARAADDPASDSARQERMDRAYEDYRNPNPGAAARTENSIKHGAHRAGSAIKHGAEKVGHAIGTGVRKTGEAIGHGGEKVQNATTPKP